MASYPPPKGPLVPFNVDSFSNNTAVDGTAGPAGPTGPQGPTGPAGPSDPFLGTQMQLVGPDLSVYNPTWNSNTGNLVLVWKTNYNNTNLTVYNNVDGSPYQAIIQNRTGSPVKFNITVEINSLVDINNTDNSIQTWAFIQHYRNVASGITLSQLLSYGYYNGENGTVIYDTYSLTASDSIHPVRVLNQTMELNTNECIFIMIKSDSGYNSYAYSQYPLNYISTDNRLTITIL